MMYSVIMPGGHPSSDVSRLLEHSKITTLLGRATLADYPHSYSCWGTVPTRVVSPRILAITVIYIDHSSM